MSYHNALALLNSRNHMTSCNTEESGKITYQGPIGSHVFSIAPKLQATLSDTLELSWSTDGTISAHLSRQNRETQQIAAKWVRGIPLDVQSNSAQISSFLKSAYVSLKPVVGTNDCWVNIYSRLLGGMGPKKNQNKTALKNLTTPNTQLVPSHPSPAAFAPQANQSSVRLDDEHVRKLTNHLESLANPTLSLKIIEFLKDMSQENAIIHPEKGMNLSDCLFAEDSIAALQEFNFSLINAFKQVPKNPNDLNLFTQQFKSDIAEKLSVISESIQKNEKQLWKVLAIFMRTSEIQRLSNDSVLQILKLIETVEAQELCPALIEILRKEKIDEKLLEKSVQEIDEDIDNLFTLCSEIIETKPRHIPFSKKLENAPSDSFNKLQLVLKKDGAHSVLGEIIGFKKNSDRSYEFQLATDEEQSTTSKICVKSDFTVTKINSYTRGLQTVLLNTGLQDGKVFHIRSRELDQQIDGDYILKNNGVNLWTLFTPDGQQRVYVLETKMSNKNEWVLNFNQPGAIVNSALFAPPIFTLRIQDINRHLKCTFSEEEPIVGINSSNIDAMLDFQQVELNPLQLLQKAKEELRIHEDQLCESLIKSESILEKLLDSLIENKLLQIDITLATEPIRILIKSISRLHREKLGEDRTEESVLREAIKSAKYASSVNSASSNANYSRRVEQIMALLEKSEKHRAQIEGGSGILFIGPTGAGKSFTIGRLLGYSAKECEHKNRTGQTIYELENSSGSSENIPEVGHSISVSQTLYTQGYPEKKNPKHFLLDTAGSSETRGDEYELCGRISLDRVIQSIDTIRAIVFVLPLQAFLVNRGSTLLEFFLAELDRFPTLFQSDTEDHKRVHILLTKKDGSSHDVIKNLREGITLDGYVSEQREELKRLQASDKDSFAIRNAKQRFQIWEAIQSIQKNGRFDIMEPLNNKKPKTLLEKYSSERVFNKSNYIAGLGSPALQRKFADSLGTYARGWRVYILEKYKNFDDSLLKAEKRIRDLNQKLDEYQLNYQKKVQDLEQNREQFEERLIQYEQQAQQNTQNISSEELSKLIEEQKKNKLMHEQVEVTSDMLKYLTLRGEAVKKATESEYFRDLAKILGQAAEEEKIILSNGDLSVPIIRLPDPKWGETILIYNTSKEEDEACLEQVRPHKESERKNQREVKTQDLKGTVEHWKCVHKDFPLIPTDEEKRIQFRNQVHQTDFGSTTIETSDRRDVQIIARNADPTTTKVVYVFKVNWDNHRGDANRYPYIHINYRIPKKTYYSGNRLPQVANAIQYHRTEKQKAENSYQNDLQEIDKIEKKYKELELLWAALKQKQQDEIHSTLEQLILGVNQELEKITEQKKALFDEKEQKIEEKQKEETAEKNNIEVLKREKRNLALVIKTQIEHAKTLHKFAQIVTNNPEQIELNDPQVNKQTFLQECKQFLSIFNEATIDELLKQSDQDLGIV